MEAEVVRDPVAQVANLGARGEPPRQTRGQLLRAEVVKEEWKEQDGETVGVLVLVYDHHTRALADKLTEIQHGSHDMIAAALHVHLDAHTCLEVIPLRGAAREIRAVANRLLATKGVRYGQLVPATGQRLH